MQSNIQKPNSDNQYIAILDGFRGLAFFLVLSQHFLRFLPGWMAIDLFFGLSGFLVTWKLVQGYDDPNYYLNFYWRRVVRIFPLYFLLLIFVFFIFPLLIPSLITTSYRDLMDIQMWYWTFCQNIYSARNNWPDNISLVHLWSLGTEIQFYLIWPFVIRFFYKRPRQLVGVIIGLIVFAILFRLFADKFMSLSNIYRYVMLPSRIDAFTIGALLYLLIHRYGHQLKQTMFWIAIAGTAAILFIYAVLHIPVNYPEVFTSRFGYTLVDITWVAWIGYGLFTTKSNLLNKIFTNKFLTSTGKYSYAMYLVHMPIWTILNRLLENKFGLQLKHEPLLLYTVSVAITLVVYGIGYISYHKFERYFMKMKLPSFGGNIPHLEPRGR